MEPEQIGSILQNVEQTTVCQANRIDQTRGRRQNNCYAHEISQAKWISESEYTGNEDGMRRSHKEKSAYLIYCLLPPKFLLISCHPLHYYSDICYLGTDEFTIFVSLI